MSNTERPKALAAALAVIERAYGKGAIMKMGDGPVVRGEETSRPGGTIPRRGKDHFRRAGTIQPPGGHTLCGQ